MPVPPGTAAVDALLRPKSIAIAGASADAGKLGSLPLTFLQRHGYAGALYPINPKLEEIGGQRCYASPEQIEGDVDLLVVALPAARIPAFLDACRPGQMKSAVVLSSGYAELGAEGEALQRALRGQALDRGLRFIGPNSVGIANLRDRVVPSISQVFDRTDLRTGPVAFVTQSGAVGTAITALAQGAGVGINYFVSTGNEGDLEFSDFCEYFVEDPTVQVIAGYLESVRDGARFLRAVRRATDAGKPVILMKVGTTEVGDRAVRSHTGSLAGAEEAYAAAFAQSGVVRARSIEQLVDYLKIFSAYPRRRPAAESARRVAIFSHSGGAGVLMADTSIESGLQVPKPSESLRGRLAARLPDYAALQNPVDMTANVIFNPQLMADTVQEAVDSGEYDAVMLCINLIWRQGKGLAEQLARFGQRDALFAVAWIAGLPEHRAALEEAGVPVFPDPVRCAEAVAARLGWDDRRRTLPAPCAARPPGRADPPPRSWPETDALLARYGIAQAPGEACTDLPAAMAAARRLGYPVAAKLLARDLLHKSDVGGVILGIASDGELQAAWEALGRIEVAGREGVLVQRMLGPGLELFAGFKRDSVFGPLVVFGLGGIYVEVLRETVQRLAPFEPDEALALLRQARFFPLLDGARGRPRCDLDALVRLLSGLSRLAVEQPAIGALDLNPIVATPQGAVVADAKLEL